MVNTFVPADSFAAVKDDLVSWTATMVRILLDYDWTLVFDDVVSLFQAVGGH